MTPEELDDFQDEMNPFGEDPVSEKEIRDAILTGDAPRYFECIVCGETFHESDESEDYDEMCKYCGEAMYEMNDGLIEESEDE
jgi:formylmethanofuran dehydrogenase subunit E